MALGSLDEAGRLIRKALSIELLEARIIELEMRNLHLLVHNNDLLARARRAEDRLKGASAGAIPHKLLTASHK